MNESEATGQNQPHRCQKSDFMIGEAALNTVHAHGLQNNEEMWTGKFLLPKLLNDLNFLICILIYIDL